jgi:hypothetical protein
VADLDLAGLKAMHKPAHGRATSWCHEDELDWPCQTAQLVAELAAELGAAQAELTRVAEERDRLAFTINTIAMLRRWFDGNGKGFVFVADLLAALRPEAVPGV